MCLLGPIVLLVAAVACLLRTRGRGYTSGGLTEQATSDVEVCVGCQSCRMLVVNGSPIEQCHQCGSAWIGRRFKAASSNVTITNLWTLTPEQIKQLVEAIEMKPPRSAGMTRH